ARAPAPRAARSPPPAPGPRPAATEDSEETDDNSRAHHVGSGCTCHTHDEPSIPLILGSTDPRCEPQAGAAHAQVRGLSADFSIVETPAAHTSGTKVTPLIGPNMSLLRMPNGGDTEELHLEVSMALLTDIEGGRLDIPPLPRTAVELSRLVLSQRARMEDVVRLLGRG